MTGRLLITILCFFSVSAQAAPTEFIYQGQIIKPDSTPLEAASVDFTVEIYTDDGNECLLYEETHNLNMTGTSGVFSLEIGSGTRSGASYEDTSTIPQILNNNQSNITPLTCTVGNSYLPASGDKRRIRVTFNDGGGPVTVANDHIVNSVPYAEYASRVGGLAITDLAQINTTAPQVLSQANLEWVFETTRYAELQALIGGTSTQYMVTSPTSAVNFNGQVIDNIAAPADGNDATNRNYVDGRIAGQTLDASITGIGAGQDGFVLSWDNANSRWEVVAQNTTDTTKLARDGSNTMSGNLPLNGNYISHDGGAGEGLVFDTTGNGTFGQDLTVTGGIGVTNGINSAGDINLETQSELRFQDDAGGEYIGLQAPTGVTSYTMELPNAAPAANQILKANASGNLVWAADDDTGDLNNGGNNGAIIVGSNDNTLALESNNTTALSFDTSQNGTFAASADVTTNLNMLTQGEVRFQDDAGGDYIALQAPTGVTTYTMELPNAAGATNQILKLNASGNLVWAADDNAGGTGDLNDGGNNGAIVVGSNDNTLALESNNTTALSFDTSQNATFAASADVTTNLNMLTQGEVRFQDDAGGDYIALQAPTGVTTYTMELPNAAPATNQILKANASGNLVWAADDDAGGDLNNGGNNGAIVVGSNNNTLALESNNTTALSFDTSQNATFAASADVTTNLNMLTQGEVRFQDDAGGDYIAFQAPTGVTTYTMELPAAAGATNQILKLNASGNLVWANDDAAAAGTITDGGNTLGQVIELGTADGFAVALRTNGTDRLQVDTSGNTNLLSQGELRLQDDSGGDYVGFRAVSGTTSYTLDLPPAAGATNQILKLNASGDLIWAADDDAGGTGDLNDGGNNGAIVVGSNDNTLALESNNTTALSFDTSQNATFAASADVTTNLNMLSQGEVRFQDDAGGDYIALQAPTGVTTYTMELPNAAGSTNQILKLNASGNLVWAADDDAGGTGDLNDGGNNGAIVVGSNDNTLALESNNTTALSFDTSQNATFAASADVTTNLNMLTQGEVRFQDDAGGDYIALQAPTGVTTYTMELPNAAGSTNQILKLNASGNLVWAADDDAGGTGDLNDGGNNGAIVVGSNDNTLALESNNTTALSFDTSQNATFAASADVTTNLNMLTQGEVRFQDDAGGDYIALQAPTGVTTYTMELPNAAGATNQILKLNASGNLIWAADDTGAAGTITDGGNTLTQTIELGTNDNFALNLRTNGTDRLQIDTSGNANVLSQGELRLQDDTGGDYIGFRAPTGVTSYTMDLPAAAGSTNQILKLNASGNLVWAADDDAGGTGDLNDGGNNGAIIVGSNDNTLALESNNTTALSFDTSQNATFAASADVTTNLNMLTQGEVRFQDDAGGDYIALQAPTGVTTYTMELPNAAGSTNQILKLNASGNLVWAADDDAGGTGDLNDGGNNGAIIVGSNDNTLALESNNTTALSFDTSQNATFAASADVTTNLNMLTQGEVRFQDDAGGDYIALQAPTGVTTYTMELPNAAGSTNEVLKLNASGNLVWSADADSGGDLNDGGNNGAIIVGSNNNTLALESNNTTALSFDTSQNATFAASADVTTNLNMLTQGEVRFQDDAGGDYIAFQAPTGVTTYTMELPAAAGSTNQILKLNASGNLIWAADDDAGGTGDLNDGGNNGAIIVGSNNNTLALESNNTTALSFDTSQNATFAASADVTTNLNMLTQGEVRFQDDAGGDYIAFQAPTGVTTYTMELPAAAGSTNQILKLNASGNLIWAADDDAGGTGDINDGGNAGAIIIGSNDNTLSLESNGTSRMQLESDGDINMDSNTLFVDVSADFVGVGNNSPDTALVVSGAMTNEDATQDDAGPIDFLNSNIMYTTRDCQTLDLHNLKSGGSYTLIVQGSNSALCAFNAFSDAGTTGLLEAMPSDHAATTASTHTIYTFIVAGTSVYFSWIPGLNPM